MRVLITGSEGFVGQHFMRALQDDNEVYGVDIARPGNTQDARAFFRSSIAHYDLVLHCAAIVGGRKVIERQPLAIAQDLSIDAEMFDWAVRTRPNHVVYFSSSAAYPVEMQRRGSSHRLRESDVVLHDPRTPDVMYGWAKLTGEIVAQHVRAEGVNVHVVRPFSGYGTDQALDYPFPMFIHRALNGADPFDIWGDGTQVRDFIHIDDIVEAVLLMIDMDIAGPVNLGTGRGTSFNQLAAMIMEQIPGYNPPINHRPAEPIGVHHRVADPFNLMQFYKPQIRLEEGITRALRGIK